MTVEVEWDRERVWIRDPDTWVEVMMDPRMFAEFLAGAKAGRFDGVVPAEAVAPPPGERVWASDQPQAGA